MKIDDVLNCINRTLEEEREARGLQRVTGHFVFHLDIQKGMGHIKIFHAYIDFFNMKVGAPYHVISVTNTLPCPVDKLEETKEQIILTALENFFKALRLGRGKGAYENYVTGEFQGWT